MCKFHRKTPVLESLFNKVAGLTPILKNICQRLLLYCTQTTHCYLPILLYIQHLLPYHHWYYCYYVCFFFCSNSESFKEFKSGISFSLKSLSSVLFSFSMFFLSFSVLFHFFLSLLIKKILLSWEMIKMFLPTLTSLKYVHVSK